jgi:hypothetical protein
MSGPCRARTSNVSRSSERELGAGHGPVRDTVLTAGRRSLQSSLGAAWWGGTYTTNLGETVVIYTSEAYVVDENANQTLANFLAGLVHSTELSRLTVYVAPLPVLQTICGSADAAGCYSPARQIMVVPGEDIVDGPAVAEIVTHEYGHHVATNRINPPWTAVDWGTKRWASRVGVCAGEAAGELFPGDQDDNYRLNPGEGFAEAYRALNGVRTGATSIAWPIVDDVFFPDQTALDLIALDVTEPWLRNTPTAVAGAFSAASPRIQRVQFSTPLDGQLRVRLRSPRGTRYRLELLADGAVVGRGRTVSGTICGLRSFTARVTRVGKVGHFSLEISKP